MLQSLIQCLMFSVNMSMATLAASSTPIYTTFSSHNQFILNRLRSTTSSRRLSLVRASKPPTEEETNSPSDNAAVVSQEDLTYLVKLGAGSIAGAAAIKYGSVIFPEITRPNIVQALIMISAPVVVAIMLLIKQSRRSD